MPDVLDDKDLEVTDEDIDELEEGSKGKTEEQADEAALSEAEQKEDLHAEDAQEADADARNYISPEEKRERNRKLREDQKRRARERREQTERELAALRARNADLNNRLATIEKRSMGTEVAALDKRINDAGFAYVHYKEQIAVQSAAGNHAGVAEATDKMLQAQREHDHYSRIKTGYQQNQNRQAQPSVDPRMMAFANKWMTDNPWYNPATGDEDSERVLTEDRILLSKGFDPSTKEYWDELTRAVTRVLPHRAKSGYTSTNGSLRSPVGGSGNGGGRKGRDDSYELSRLRVEAIKEAGMWDDPKKRKLMIDNFKRFDAQKR